MTNLDKQADVMPPAIIIPYGFCRCGCGKRTQLAKQNHTALGHIKGQPVSFILGHNFRYHRLDMNETSHFRVDSVYCRLVPLTQRLFAIVNETDYEWISHWEWYARWIPHIRSYYACRWSRAVNGKQVEIRMHREILGLDSSDAQLSDHKDPFRTLENTRNNLRLATCAENSRNARKSSTNTSGYKGVSYDKNRNLWRSTIRVDGKSKSLGRYATKEAAHATYCEAAHQYFGDFARMG